MVMNFVRKAMGLGFWKIDKGYWGVAIVAESGAELKWSGNGLPEWNKGYKTRNEARDVAKAIAEALEETDSEYDRACLARIRHIKACRAAGLDPWQTAEEWAVAA